MGKSLKGKELGVGISQRKDGMYQGRFTNYLGKRVTIYGKTLPELREKMRYAEYSEQTNTVDSNMTLDEWFDIWINTCKAHCRNSTKATYAKIYNRARDKIGNIKLRNLNMITIQRFINSLPNDYQRKKTNMIISDMLDKAVDNDILSKNPAKKVKTKFQHTIKKERRVLTVKEQELFLKHSQKSYYHNLYVLALNTGMRIGEILALTWDDVADGFITINKTFYHLPKDGHIISEIHEPKTASGYRKIPIVKDVTDALKSQKKLQAKYDINSELIFTTKWGTPIYLEYVQNGIDYTIKRIRKERPDFERFSIHCLRHTFATRAIEKGVNPKVLQKILGHSTLSVTMDLYCHTTDDTVLETFKTFFE